MLAGKFHGKGTFNHAHYKIHENSQ